MRSARADSRTVASSVVAGVVAMALVSLACPGPPKPPRHLLLISVDTLRADRVDAERMPRIHRLAQKSDRFERAWATAPFTLPSISTMLTGRDPQVTGIHANLARLPLDVPTLSTRLSEIGFRADMFQEFEAVARGQIVQVGKIRMNVRDYSRLVARTQMREAHTIGTIARLQQNSVDHVQISQHAQDEPDECTPWAGNVYYIGDGEDPAGFPRLDTVVGGGPPFHPNCEHVLIPYVIDFKTADAVEKDKDATKALPRRFFGKGANDVRKLVGELPRKELLKIAPRGVGDLRKVA